MSPSLDKSKLVHRIRSSFNDQFNETPILVFAPGRINIIGEHTDYNDGFVFPAAIDKGIVAAVQISNRPYSKIIALDVEDELQLDINDLRPIEKGGWKNYVIGVIAEIKKVRSQLSNFNLVFGGNIPIGGGVSSSAALENSIGFALNELFELGLTQMELIKISQRADHNYVGINSGIMDHFASMFGQTGAALLLDCRSLTYKQYQIDLKDFQFLLINTNVSHELASSAYNKRRATCEHIASLLQEQSLRDVSFEALESIKSQIDIDDYNKAYFVISENQRTHQAAKALQLNNLDKLGELLYQSHDGLKTQYEVSCNELDFLVDLSRNNTNILGARMMGGGFGGCTLNLIKSGAIKDFKASTLKAYYKKFNKECSFYEVRIANGTHRID